MVEWRLGLISGITVGSKVRLFCYDLFTPCICLLPDLVYAKFFFLAFTALKKKRDRLESEMEQLGSVRELQLKESEATEKKSGLERKIDYLGMEEVLD